MVGMVADPTALPPLREEIHCLAGPAGFDGAPTWTLHDPANNRFYRIGWPEFEILSRWRLAVPQAIADAIGRETTLAVSAEQVADLGKFLMAHNLLRAEGPAGLEGLRRQAAARRIGVGEWLLHNYLFFKIPLVRPDAWLARCYPRLAWLYSGRCAALFGLCALLALFLLSRQWDAFLNTFPYFFNWLGLAQWFLALALAKTLHEFGHALTAHRYGCRVPTMGVAFMVMYPMLYTDASEAWRLVSRRQRLAIAGAGVAAELGLAVVAALAWSFLPDGPARGGAFLLATSTWIVTLAVNLSPFMRFDGYYLLADWLGVDNLQARAFAYARWRMRTWLFGLDWPAPEILPPRMARFFAVYAWGTWLYRFFLFLGIAVLVYHFSFKLLGLLLMAVEIGWFIVRPIVSELRVWWSLSGHDIGQGRRLTGLAALLGVAALLLLPWQGYTTAPAMIRAEQYAEIVLPRAGRLESFPVAAGQSVKRGELLARLSSPELDYQASDAGSQGRALAWQLAYQGLRQELLQRRRVLLKELESAAAKQAGTQEQQAELTLSAPFDGVALDVNDALQVGQWLPAGEAMLIVADPGAWLVEAYLAEEDLLPAEQAVSGWFYPDDPVAAPVACRVERIDRGGSARIPDALASSYGGELAARPDRQGLQIPERAVYRIVLRPIQAPSRSVFPGVRRGSVRLDTPAVSLLSKAWRRVATVVVRESGF